MSSYSILCIGDSHTAGFPSFDPIYGGNPESSYQFWLLKLLNSNFSDIKFRLNNQGVCGQTTKEITFRLDNILLKEHFELIIYCGGANDIAIGYSTHKIWQNIEKALKNVQPSESLFFLLTIPPMNWSEAFHPLREINEKIMKTRHIENCFPVDIYAALENKGYLDRNFDAGDGVHLSIHGYKKVGDIIFKAISNVFTS